MPCPFLSQQAGKGGHQFQTMQIAPQLLEDHVGEDTKKELL